jgi:hypothetical protein
VSKLAGQIIEGGRVEKSVNHGGRDRASVTERSNCEDTEVVPRVPSAAQACRCSHHGQKNGLVCSRSLELKSLPGLHCFQGLCQFVAFVAAVEKWNLGFHRGDAIVCRLCIFNQ